MTRARDDHPFSLPILKQFENYNFIAQQEITVLPLPIRSIRIFLIRRRIRKEVSREASSYKVGRKLLMKQTVAQSDLQPVLCSSKRKLGRGAIYFKHSSNITMTVVMWSSCGQFHQLHSKVDPR
jgi:hypothetical protein